MSKVWGERFAIVPDDVLMAEVSANAKVLWALLARHADPEGGCYPGLKNLAGLMKVSTDTVSRAKKELIEAELLTAEERYDDQGRRTSDHLFLQGAHRKFAVGVHRKFAVTGSSTQKEVDNYSRPDRKSDPGAGQRQSHERWDRIPFQHEIEPAS